MRLVSACLLATVLPGAAVAQSSRTWLCISDKSTGFSNETVSGWRSADFTAGDRYIVKQGSQASGAWVVQPFGEENPFAAMTCPNDFTSDKILHCRGMLTEFKFNAGTGRFLRAYLGGYWTYVPGNPFFGKDRGDTPQIEIGTCASL